MPTPMLVLYVICSVLACILVFVALRSPDPKTEQVAPPPTGGHDYLVLKEKHRDVLTLLDDSLVEFTSGWRWKRRGGDFVFVGGGGDGGGGGFSDGGGGGCGDGGGGGDGG